MNRRMVRLAAFLIFASSLLSRGGWSAIGHKPELDPYVSFLKGTSPQDPVDYVFHLFETKDVVIIADSVHEETTQWELFSRIVQDARFRTTVGNVFTELGSVSQQPDLGRIIHGSKVDEEAVKELLRNFPIHPPIGWNVNNFYEFLLDANRLNLSLAEDEKINVFFSDIPWKWDNLSKSEFEAWQALLGSRDKIMADRILLKLRKLAASKGRMPKALVIMNTRHGYGAVKRPDGSWFENTGTYLFRHLGDRVANVMIHGVSRQFTSGGPKQALIAQGKWDATFFVNKDRPVGFDLKGSPFGDDRFDNLLPLYGHLTYQEVFTGLIFHAPLKDQRVHGNIPAFYDETTKRTLRTRCKLQPGACERQERYWQALEKSPEEFGRRPLYQAEFLEPMHRWLLP